VLLYNYAEVQDRILVHAEQETARIFRRANVELSWVDCPVSDGQVEKLVACSQAMGSFTATLKLLTKSMAQGFRQPASRFGLTIPHHGSYVFCHRVQELSQEIGLSQSVLLGHLMAHEFGHLLLGKRHSFDGIMSDDLHVKFLHLAEKGMQLNFSTEQAQQIHARLKEEDTQKATARRDWPTYRIQPPN